MTPQSYTALATYLKRKSGIVLGENKGYLVDSRLTPVAKAYGFASIEAMVSALPMARPDLAEAVVDAMTTNESFFFRDNTPFKLFEEVMMPALTAARRTTGQLRIWCAAASTGQEPYSLAMILKSNPRLAAGLRVEIIGTDISDTALDQARAGRYTQFEVQRGLPVQLLVSHFRQEGTSWVISEEIKRMVRFSKLNLLDPLASIGSADIVFLRNVLIYFDVATKATVLQGVHKIMRPDGYLVLGAAETLMGVTDIFARAGDARGLYQPKGQAGARLLA